MEKTLIDARVHVLYCGVTQSGKTTLARFHARKLAAAGYDVAVYDPMGSATAGGGWPDTAKMFNDPAKFLEYLSAVRGTPEHPIYVFVDEAADIFGHDSPFRDMHWIPRRVRHQNVYLRLVSQRPKMLPPNVRTQCAIIYMFRLSREDARLVGSDAGHSLTDEQINLDTGDFLLLVSGTSDIEEFNCFDLVD